MMDQATTKEHEHWIASVCDHLNKLIQLDVDAACTYREAIAHVDDNDVRADLQGFLRDHERHVIELSTIIRELGGAPVEAHRDLKGALLEGVTKLRSRNTIGALRAMRTNEKLTNRTYGKANEKYMPPIGQAIVMENLADERRHLAAIEAHIERFSGRHLFDADQVSGRPDSGDRERPFPIM